ncbi:pumilio homolog 12-like [Pistacia vera]|uniref:pumilio homolog 12-like n=1 Tax=Pistacia vera TaxID=55513 RepID=UPI001263434C|nr:pumilio homolog 12-like [Pistacia vera]
MEGRGEGYPPQLYTLASSFPPAESYSYELPSLRQVNPAMLQNQNSQNHVSIHPPPQNHCAQISNLRNLFYQDTLLPNNYMQNPSFQNPNPATMQNHQAVLCYPPNINSNAIFLSGQYGQSTPRRYGRFDNVLYGQSSPPGHQFLGRGQTAAYNPRHSGALSNLSHDLSDLSGPDQFNLSTLTSGSNFNNFLQRRSHFSCEFSREYSAGPSSSRNRSIRVDLLGSAGRSINESHIVLPSSSSRGKARGRQHSSHTSLEELRGRVCLAAKDQKECRFLQKKVDERNPMDITIIFMEVKDDLPDLMVHQFANYLIQKLIGVLNEQQMTEFIRSVVSSEQRLFRICDDVHGTRVIQKLLDSREILQRQSLKPEQICILLSALKKIAVNLSKSPNGQHVIQRCFHKFSNEYTKELVEEIVESCVTLAIEKSGCCVLQQCIFHAKEEHKGRLIAEIVTNALVLSDHAYGNYVVQYILEINIPQVTADVLSQFSGSYFTLSLSKYASNVVEKCMKFATEEQLTAIVSEIIHHPDILDLMLNNFGNFVIQSAWKRCKGRPLGQTLLNLVQEHYPLLQSHMYGKKGLSDSIILVVSVIVFLLSRYRVEM